MRTTTTVVPCLAALALISACNGCPAADTSGTSDAGGGGVRTGSSRGGTASGASGARGSSSTPTASSRAAGSSAAAHASSTAAATSTGGTSSSSSSTGGIPPPAHVFAHSATVLYRLDADTLALTELGPITFRDGGNTVTAQITDFAVTSTGDMWACGRHVLWHLELATRVATKVADLVEDYTGLTFVPVGMLEPDREVLVGATANNGSLYRIDTATGASTLLGAYGGSWETSGDVVAIHDDGMYATVRTGGTATTDHLARIEPSTGVATIIGGSAGIGATRTFGLGYWGGVLYAFTDGGKILRVDRTTGVGTVLETTTMSFWGAGVTTSAKIN